MTDAVEFSALIARVRGGEREAMTQFVQRYERVIRRAAQVRGRLGRLQRVMDSSDLCQSVMAKFLQKLAAGAYDLQNPEALQFLLAAMARNRLRDHVRKDAAAKRGPGVNAGQTPNQVANPAAGPASQAADRELLALVRERLSPAERTLADLRMEGYEWDEIANKVGGTAEACRKQLERAIARVREALKDKG